MLSNIDDSFDSVYLGGDFNIDLLKKYILSSRLLDTMLSYGLRNQILAPTRICSTTATCIDNVFVFGNDDCTSTLTGDFLTDHQGIIIVAQ